MTRPAKQVKWQHYSNNNEAIKRAKTFFPRELCKAQLIIARVETVSSPRLDTAPGGGSHGNSSEDSMIRAVMARQLLKEIDATLDAMNDEDAEILRLRYFKGWSPVKCSMETYTSERTIYRHEKTALEHWAYIGHGGELLEDNAVLA